MVVQTSSDGQKQLTSSAEEVYTDSPNSGSVLSIKKLASVSLLSFCGLLTLGLFGASNNSQSASDGTTSESVVSATIQEPTGLDGEQDEQDQSSESGASSSVRVNAQSNVQGGSNSQATVQGSISTTGNDGVVKTETFHESYTSTGNSPNSIDVNVSSSTSNDTTVDINEGNNFNFDLDVEEPEEPDIDN